MPPPKGLKAGADSLFSCRLSYAIDWLLGDLGSVGIWRILAAHRSRILYAAAIVLLIAAGAGAYFLWWRTVHYVKEAKTVVVDLRRKGTGSFNENATDPAPPTHYIAFCSRFSENPVGFPGHGFVLWSQQWPPAPELHLCETAGYYPRKALDQIVALVTPVPAVFVKEPRCPDPECVEYTLVAAVDGSTGRAP